MKQYLFVYGSLRKGFEPPEIAETAEKLKLVGEAFIYADLYDLGEFTTAISGGTNRVFGQILELPDETEVLRKLDEYEGFYPNDAEKSLFLRKKTFARLGDEKIETWIYEYNGDLSKFPLINNRNFLNP